VAKYQLRGTKIYFGRTNERQSGLSSKLFADEASHYADVWRHLVIAYENYHAATIKALARNFATSFHANRSDNY